jgi:hypothetical protein
MIVSQVASESILNMNETEDSNKNWNKNKQDDETTPKYGEINCKKRKQQKASEFQKLTQKRLVYNELSPNLEPKVNDVQLR